MSRIKEDLKRVYGDKCQICGLSGKIIPLNGAHYKAGSIGGKMMFLLCPNHHRKYDKGLLTSAELKKIGLTKRTYGKYMPKKMSTRAKPDEQYYFLWGDGKRRYTSEATLPKTACPPKRHGWEQSWVSGTYRCTKCKAKRVSK